MTSHLSIKYLIIKYLKKITKGTLLPKSSRIYRTLLPLISMKNVFVPFWTLACPFLSLLNDSAISNSHLMTKSPAVLINPHKPFWLINARPSSEKSSTSEKVGSIITLSESTSLIPQSSPTLKACKIGFLQMIFF